MRGFRRCGHVSVFTGYVSANGHKTRHQSEGIVPCGDCGADVEKRINLSFQTIEYVNTVMHGKSIELFLVNGSADSIVTAELSNWNARQ